MNVYAWVVLGVMLATFLLFLRSLMAFSKKNQPTMFELKESSPIFDTVGTSGYRVTAPVKKLQWRTVQRYSRKGE